MSNQQDPFFFDREGLQAFAAEAAIAAGLSDFKDHRVIEIEQDQEMLWGQVEDEDQDQPLEVEICLGPDGDLSFACECESSQTEVCRHQIAAFYAYADRKAESEQLLCASDSAIRDRVKRGQAEVQVEHLSGEPWFGTWRAASIASTSHYPRQYRVSVRSLERRINVCTCPDFVTNQLGTCKHIEAVLHKIRKRPDFKDLQGQSAPVPYVYLAWDVEDAPQICLHRGRSVPQDLAAVFETYFDAAGGFTGRLPDDFFRFAERVEGHGGIHLGEDAVDFARQLASDAAHRLRAEQIRARIASSSGRIPGVKARLYPYQVEGAAFLAGTGRALLADDMGLGKTLQAIAAATWLKEHEGLRRILIICPASLKQQWAREISRFTDLDSSIVEGRAAERAVQYRQEASFFIINYELVLRDLSVINDILCPDLIIMDEAQRIKNWRTKIAAAVKRIPSRFAFVLSGTPLENRLEDLYSLMQVVDPKVLGPLWRYLVDFHITDARGKVLGYRNLSLLRRRLEPVMLRRDRRLVRDQLPDRVIQQLDVTMSAAQRELHDAAMSAAGSLAAIARKRPLTPSEQNRLLASLQQARMACNAAALVDKETEGSPKLDELAELLEELCLQSGLKAVVFSQWERMTHMVDALLRRMGIGGVRLHGGVPSAKRGALMDRFRDDDAVQVFISTDAGGVGLNLQSASVLINLDVPWNPAVLEQRNARIHRLGQTRKVQIITMVAADSYEEHVLSLVQNKQNLFDNVVSEDATEDVVGVSRKLLETLIDDLTKEASAKTAEEAPAVDSTEVGDEIAPAAGSAADAPAKFSEVEQELTEVIEALQKAFGRRIERILGANGGIVAVLDRVDAEADRIAEKLSTTVPVALIDPLGMKGLQRLGAGSPLTRARTFYEATEAPAESRLASLAAEKIQAAQVLLNQQLADSALDLTVAALLAAAADRAGRNTPLTRQEAGVWLYSEALPGGILDQQEAGLLMRGLSLSQAQEVPRNLVAELTEDVSRFIGGV